MSPQEIALQNAAEALRRGLIDWFRYFELCREILNEEEL
jgi:hypothetical protein